MKKYKLKNNYYSNIYELVATKKYIKALHDENFKYILNLINDCEFDIEINENGTINLIDLQGAYLGDFESYQNFNDIFEACQRLDGSFLFDYFGIC